MRSDGTFYVGSQSDADAAPAASRGEVLASSVTPNAAPVVATVSANATSASLDPDAARSGRLGAAPPATTALAHWPVGGQLPPGFRPTPFDAYAHPAVFAAMAPAAAALAARIPDALEAVRTTPGHPDQIYQDGYILPDDQTALLDEYAHRVGYGEMLDVQPGDPVFDWYASVSLALQRRQNDRGEMVPVRASTFFVPVLRAAKATAEHAAAQRRRAAAREAARAPTTAAAPPPTSVAPAAAVAPLTTPDPDAAEPVGAAGAAAAPTSSTAAEASVALGPTGASAAGAPPARPRASPQSLARCTCRDPNARRQGRHANTCPRSIRFSGDRAAAIPPGTLRPGHDSDAALVENDPTLPELAAHSVGAIGPHSADSATATGGSDGGIASGSLGGAGGGASDPAMSLRAALRDDSVVHVKIGQIVQLGLPTLASIPKAAVAHVANCVKAVSRVLQAAAPGTLQHERAVDLWHAMPTLLLGRAGPQRTASLAQTVSRRCAQFTTATGLAALWQEAQEASAARLAARRRRQASDAQRALDRAPGDSDAEAGSDDEAAPPENDVDHAIGTHDDDDAPGLPEGDSGETWLPNGGTSEAHVAAGAADSDDDSAGTSADDSAEADATTAHGPLGPPHLDRLLSYGAARVRPEVAKRAKQLALAGEYGRAAAALSSNPVAEATVHNLEKLRALHPVHPLPVPAPIQTPTTYRVDAREATKLVMSLSPNTGSGPSRWKATHLQQLVKHDTSNVAADLAPIMQATISGQMAAPDVAWTTYGASMVGIVKDPTNEDPPLRPIASGELLTRAAGRGLGRHVRDEAAQVLRQRHQYAVGVRGGSEAIVHAARRLLHRMLANPEAHRRVVWVKTDMANAYNNARREKILEAAAKWAPDTVPYYTAALGNTTPRYFGNAGVIESTAGVGQGDPLGTLAFCLSQALMRDEIPPELIVAMLLELWFADDGTLAADLDDMQLYLEAIEALGPEYGLMFKRVKFVFSCFPELKAEAAARLRIPESQFVELERLEVMGAPIGSEAATSAFTAAVVDGALETAMRIAQIPHTHASATTLVYVMRGVATYLTRNTLVPIDELRRLAKGLTECLSDVYGIPATPQVVAQLQLPYSDGGFGLKNPAAVRELAFLASRAETLPLVAAAVPSLANERLSADPLVVAAVAAFPRSDALATVLEEIEHHVNRDPATIASDEPRPARLQHRWTRKLEDATRETRVRAAGGQTTDGRARLQSCAASGAEILHPRVLVPYESARPWLSDKAMCLLARMRCGLPLSEVAAADGATTRPCVMCPAHHPADTHGVHSRRCMGGGFRARLHTEVVQFLHDLSGRGLLAPRREVSVAGDGAHRLDLALNGLRDAAGRTAVVDFTAVDTQQDAFKRRAAAAPGGGAHAAEAIKHRRYDAVLATTGHFLVPFVADFYGAIGPAGLALLRRLSRRIADRSGERPGAMWARVRQATQLRIQRSIADLMQANHGISAGPPLPL